MRRCLLSLFLFAALSCGCIAVRSDGSNPKHSSTHAMKVPEFGNANVREAAAQTTLKLPLIKPRIRVWKAKRKMELFSAEKIVRTYRVGLGLSPVGDKVREGDRSTPEGAFYVFTKNDKSAFYLSLGLSYPNLAHAKRGLRQGLITQAQYDRIAAAIKSKR